MKKRVLCIKVCCEGLSCNEAISHTNEVIENMKLQLTEEEKTKFIFFGIPCFDNGSDIKLICKV